MNVLVVVPPYPNRIKEYLILPCLDLCVWSAILKENSHSVELIDMRIEGMNDGQFREQLLKYQPELVVLDDEPRAHCNTKRLIPIIKEVYKNQIYVAVRGEIPSFIPEKIMERNPLLDFIICHDDDYALLNIVNAIRQNDEFSKINNIAFRNDDGSVTVTERKYNEYKLDDLPMPDRKLYDIDKYLKRDTETIVRSSRGCPGHCLFCIKTKFAKFQLFSVQRFCDEIEELLSYGFTSFFFSDDTFAFSDKRLEEFAAEVKKRGLKFRWTSNLRIKDINDYKIKLMKEIGAYRVFIGVETANANTSEVIGKNLEYNEIIEKTNILHKYGMEFHASFILGNPGDKNADIEATLDLVKTINPTLVTFNQIKVYPGIELYQNPEKFGLIVEDEYWFEKDDWSQRVVAWTKDLSAEDIERWSRRCLFEFINR